MRHTLPPLALASAVAATAVVAVAPAHAAPAPATIKVNPTTVVIQAKSSTWATVTITAPGLGADSWIQYELRGPKSGYEGDVLEDPNHDGVFTGRVKFDRYAPAGSWNAETSVYDTNVGEERPGPKTKFNVLLGTRLSVNAGPEPVRKGKNLTVTGRLTRLDAYAINGDYPGFGKQRVAVYFLKKGAKKWTYQGAATTAANGSYKKVFKAKVDGTWYATYTGSFNSSKVTSTGDYVDVR